MSAKKRPVARDGAAKKSTKAAPQKRGRGRPSAYRPEFAAQAAKLCALGATDVELADFFGVSIRTLDGWKVRHEEFLRALKASKEEADNRVERSLFQRATGYTHDAVKIFMPAGAKKPVFAEYREHVPPDTTACIFWLKNRRREEWRDKVDHEHAGPNGGAIPVATVDASKLSTATLQELLNVRRAATDGG